MRTTITLPDETHEFAAYYARVRGITLGAAIHELICNAKATAAAQKPEVAYSPNGLPMFPLSGKVRVVTSEMVEKLEEEEFDPKKFA